MKISILGIGNWGCSIAHLLCNRGHKIALWGRNVEKVQSLRCQRIHPNQMIKLDTEIEVSNNLDEIVADTDVIIEAVTLSGLRSVIAQINRMQFNAPIIATSKGIEKGSSLFPSQIIEEGLNNRETKPVLIFSGPTISREITGNCFSSAVLACKNIDLANILMPVFQSENLEVFVSNDTMGVQLGGAFKNIFAIGCGILDGLKCGDNAKACLITMGLSEMRCLAIKLRYMPQTLYGLSGLGDLIATCLSSYSRNFQLGQCLGKGISLNASLEKIGAAVEGISTGREILILAKRNQINLPISLAIYNALDKGLNKVQFFDSLRKGQVTQTFG